MFLTLFVVYTHDKCLHITLRVTYSYYYIFSVKYNRKCRGIFGLVYGRSIQTRRYALLIDVTETRTDGSTLRLLCTHFW